jgi:quercetin dioxygenase-like cupin family protein
MRAEGLTASSWGNGPGDRYDVHEHPYDKALVAMEGSIVLTLPDRDESVELRVGDRLDLPADTRHGAEVGPTGVTCLEAHVVRGSLGPRPIHRPGWARASDETSDEHTA